MSYEAPFEGVRVVDVSQGLAAPYCASLLAQHGADVVKVEPVGGDWSRLLGPVQGDHTAFSITANLGKRSIAANLKDAQGRAILWRLLRGADLLIEGFRPGVIDRMGFGYDAVCAREPRILMLSVSGFGPVGPLAERPAMDPVLQAYTGLTMENAGEDGIPRRVPISIVDMSTGLYAFQAASAALYARLNQPRGRHLQVSLLQAATAMQAVRLLASTFEGATLPVNIPPSGAYRTADGWVTIQIATDRDWKHLCEALEVPGLADDARFRDRESRLANGAALAAAFRPVFAAKPMAHWEARFVPARILHERLNTYREFLSQAHVEASQTVSWLRQPGLAQPVPVPNLPGLAPLADGSARARAPRCGEHTDEVLAGLGYDHEEIAELRARGIVAGPTRTPADAPADRAVDRTA